jgi:ABC-type nitrate/sulfonate/bicarbonate transport system substrate-binding protein
MNRSAAARTVATAMIALAAAVVVALPPPAAAQAPTLRVQYIVPTDQLVSLCEIPTFQQSVLKHLGKRYRLELSRAQGTPFLVAAMAAGEADVAYLAYNSFASAVIKGVVPGGLTIVASDFYDANPDYYSFQWLARADSSIHGVQDLRGKKIGVLAIGTGADATTRLMLKKTGLDPVKDVSIVEIPAPAMEEAVKSRKIDAGFFPALFYYRAMSSGEGYRKVFDSYQAWGRPYLFSFVVARTDVLKKTPEAVKAFLDDVVALQAHVYKPENREAVIEAVATHFKAPKAVLQQFYLTKKDVYRPLDGRVKPDDLQHALSRLHELGFLDKDVPVAQYVDNSYLPR